MFDSLSLQLAKAERNDDTNPSTKFRFKDISSGARLRDYITAIDWLSEAGIICPCYNTSCIASPISAYKLEGQFKLYFNDTGLFLSTLSNDVIKTIDINQDNTYKGYIYENLIADALSKNDIDLYYFGDYKKEIDFLIPTNSYLLACEVKSGRVAMGITHLLNSKIVK